MMIIIGTIKSSFVFSLYAFIFLQYSKGFLYAIHINFQYQKWKISKHNKLIEILYVDKLDFVINYYMSSSYDSILKF